MAKTKTWQAALNGKMHTFVFTVKAGRKGGYFLSVDGKNVLSGIQPKWSAMFTGAEFPFQLDGREVNLVVVSNNKADIVADGHYLSTGKPYVPQPKWIWFFVIPIIPLIFMGGALGALCGVAGFLVGDKAARSSQSTWVRVVLCVICMALGWAVYFLLAYLFLKGMNRL